jgi:hypothetical protein
VPTFAAYPLAPGPLADLPDDRHPTAVAAWGGLPLHLPDTGTHFGCVFEGMAYLDCASGSFPLRGGMYFAVPGAAVVRGGKGLVVTHRSHRGLFHLGGPVEPAGRLRYIDGCTDSLLVPPVVCGDPCLNLLHVPPHTRQAAHTHPSVRVGLVLRGEGACATPDGDVPLRPGVAFVIRPGGPHAFRTAEGELLVMAYHPDSDFGPTHEYHPMNTPTALNPNDRPGEART